MTRASTVEIDDLALQDVPGDIREALSAAADSILTKWESPFPGPNWADLEAVSAELQRYPRPAPEEQS
jgi:hypothetical protein